MTRFLLVGFGGFGLLATAIAAPPADDCYSTVGPLLRGAGGKLTPEVRSAYLDWAEKRVLRELRLGGKAIPADCLAEVRKNPTLRDAMFGSVYPPDPSILQNYARFRAELGEKFLEKYRSFAIAMAVAKRTKGVDTRSGPDVGRDYQPGFWVDESLQVPGSDEEKQFVRAIADFLRQTDVAALDVYEKPALQQRLRASLSRSGIPSRFLGEIQKSVSFGERLKNAMILLGQRPAARDRKPVTAAWMRHLVQLNEATPSSTPTLDGKPMPWPLFPIRTAPWPLLMPLAHPVPLTEATYVWEAFQGVHGPDRYHTYGPYRGDEDVVPDSLRPSKWFWDAWPDRIVHGGMCVPISKGTVDLYSALGKPAMWAGQPGHANLISFQRVGEAWTAEIEQAFAGGPDVTFAQWYFDEEPGGRIRFRDLYDWAGAEYPLGLARAMNVGLKPYVDSRIAANLFRALPPAEKGTTGVALLRGAIQANPFNPELWYRLAEQTPDAAGGMALVEAARKGDPSLLSTPPGRPFGETPGLDGASAQYWQTVALFAAHYSILSHPAPTREEEMRKVYRFLGTVPGIRAENLAAYAEKFGSAEPAEEAVKYDQLRANENDPFGYLRLGQRYRDGDGVPQDDLKARSMLMRAAALGDGAAAMVWAEMTPTISGDRVEVTASQVFGPDQLARHLTDGSGLVGAVHDNEGAAKTMWHTGPHPAPTPPAPGLRSSPAWVRFDFARPMRFQSVLIWNHNQGNLTNRGFRKARLYGSPDGTRWIPLGAGPVEIPQASGTAFGVPFAVPNDAADRPLKSVIVAAETVDGNYGGECYGLSEVRFAIPTLSRVVPLSGVSVTASSAFSSMQSERHLIDGSGMFGSAHDNLFTAETMWHTPERPASTVPAPGMPASPAWVRFDFARPQTIESFLIWNHNQENLTDRGFRKARLYGTSDGTTWFPLTATPVVELPRASGSPAAEPYLLANAVASRPLKTVVIAAEASDGNHGGSCYGLSAVRFLRR